MLSCTMTNPTDTMLPEKKKLVTGKECFMVLFTWVDQECQAFRNSMWIGSCQELKECGRRNLLFSAYSTSVTINETLQDKSHASMNMELTKTQTFAKSKLSFSVFSVHLIAENCCKIWLQSMQAMNHEYMKFFQNVTRQYPEADIGAPY